MSKTTSLSVKKIIKETADAISLLFDIPETHKANFKFKAGQYITINKTLDGKKIKRAYSLCTAPYEETLQVVIKRIQGGNFSVYATENIQEEDILEIGFPEGRFVLDANPKNQKHYIAFTAGSGITPIYSMLKEVLHTEPNSKFTLVYGNKTPEKTIFYNELNTLAENNNHFNLQYVFSQSNEENALFGRVDASIVKLMLNRDNYDAFYICGPTIMTETIITTLVEKGITKDNIHYELFTAKTEKDNQNMENTAITGKVKVTILLDDEQESFEMDAKEIILKAALTNDIDAPYSCQGGICSSCIGKVTKGKAKMLKNEILTEKEIEDGLILTCQAIPESNEIIIDFDDV
jgi:ring-1,2-phenylacetyl-CoA epoxidase subunit PaaE